MIRGINKEFVFQSDDERRLLLELLCDQQTSGKLELAASCIMNNHLHAIVKAELETLSRAIKVINLCGTQRGTIACTGARVRSLATATAYGAALSLSDDMLF